MNSETERVTYQMNPAEDYVIFGDELAEGMWVLPQSDSMRRHRGWADEDLRGQRFCRVTRLRHNGDLTVFVGEWVDGFQYAYRVHHSYAWIVKREPEKDQPGSRP